MTLFKQTHPPPTREHPLCKCLCLWCHLIACDLGVPHWDPLDGLIVTHTCRQEYTYWECYVCMDAVEEEFGNSWPFILLSKLVGWIVLVLCTVPAWRSGLLAYQPWAAALVVGQGLPSLSHFGREVNTKLQILQSQIVYHP
jgi:hypothetical protein